MHVQKVFFVLGLLRNFFLKLEQKNVTTKFEGEEGGVRALVEKGI